MLLAIEREIETLLTTTNDWASWDDTYTFMEDLNPDYLQSNLIDDTFVLFRFAWMVYVSTSGDLVYGKAYDHELEDEVPLSTGLQDLLAAGATPLRPRSLEEGSAGLLRLEEDLYLVAAQPILTSQDQGPSRGVFLVGRPVDESFREQIVYVTQLPVLFHQDPASKVFRQDWTMPRVYPIQLVGANGSLIGYGLLDDVFGNPAMVIEVVTPLEFAEQARLGTRYLVFALVVFGLLAVGFSIILLNSMILNRLRSLYHFVMDIGPGERLSQRVSLPGNDELSELGQAVNRMLDGLEEHFQERRQVAEKIRYLSFHDSLTGCYNRAFIEEELKRLGDSRLLPLGVVLCDMNGLKLTNDVFGHQAGDRLLQHFARLLRDSCRREDLIGRWGGDEFILMLPQVRESTIRELTDRIRADCRQADPVPVPLSVSLGWSVKVSPDEAVEAVINRAEAYMYRTKLDESRSVRAIIIGSLEQTLRDLVPGSEAHVRRMSALGKEVARLYHLREQDLKNLDLLARLHDLGLASVPRTIIRKQGPLTPEEWEAFKKHPEVGYRIAQSSPELVSIAEEILTHHEHWDGSGYPRGLKGEEIPLLARIIAVLGAYDVMTSGLFRAEPVSADRAIRELERRAGTSFDPQVVKIFVRVVGGELGGMTVSSLT